MVTSALEAFGTVDVLVNNIAAAMPGNVVDTSIEDFDRVLDVSLRTVFLACKHVVPTMADKGSGAIVNIGSIAAFRGGNYVGYAAAKGALHAMTVDMAYSHGRQGIRVNAIAPGHLTTPMLLANEGQTPQTDLRQRMANAAGLLGTEGNGWDVGWAAAFLASDEARWITGATLPGRFWDPERHPADDGVPPARDPAARPMRRTEPHASDGRNAESSAAARGAPRRHGCRDRRRRLLRRPHDAARSALPAHGGRGRGGDRGDATGGHRPTHRRPRIRRGVPAGPGRVVPEGPSRLRVQGRSTSDRANGFPAASLLPEAWRRCRRRTSVAGWRSSPSSRTCAG